MFKILVVLAVAAVAISEAKLVRPLVPPAFAKAMGDKLKMVDDERIVGGEIAVDGQFPHQIALFSVFLGIKTFFCGGTLIAPNLVVTAAHCMAGQLAGGIVARAGEFYLDSASGHEVEITGKKITRHAEYDGNIFINDIALLELVNPFPINDFIQVLALPEHLEEPRENSTCRVTGWGSTAEGGLIARRLHFVDVPHVQNDRCNSLYSDIEIVDHMLCAGVAGKDACQGDSGGPIICDDANSLSGIVSWGYGCAQEGFPGVYTKVSHFRPWLLEHAGV